MPIIVPTPPPPPTPVVTYGPRTTPEFVFAGGGDVLPAQMSEGLIVLPGVEGLDTPPVTLTQDEPAMWDGSLHRHVRYRPRQVFLPMQLVAADTATMRAAIRRLAVITDPKRGPTTVTVAHHDGATRSVDGYLASPFGAALDAREGVRWRKFGLAFTCPDPYFAGNTETITFRFDGGIDPFLGPVFLPLHLSNSQVLGDVTIHNAADAESWPVWTLTGPTDAVEISSNGLSWTLPDGIADGETVIVDCRRGVQTVTDATGAAWDRLGPLSNLWALPPGDNEVGLTMTGAEAGATVTVAWQQRWLTAW